MVVGGAGNSRFSLSYVFLYFYFFFASYYRFFIFNISLAKGGKWTQLTNTVLSTKKKKMPNLEFPLWHSGNEPE